jgi:hypothetical protein
MRAQDARASPGSPRIQTVIRADPRKADVDLQILIKIVKNYSHKLFKIRCYAGLYRRVSSGERCVDNCLPMPRLALYLWCAGTYG